MFMLLALAFIGSTVAAAAFIGGAYALIRSFARCPRLCRGHFRAALIWTSIAAIQTVVLLLHPASATLVGYLVLLASGSVWIASWKQLARRRLGELPVQKWHSLPIRLYVQTFWGPLALGAVVVGINCTGQRFFEDAVVQRDLPTAFVMKEYGLANVDTFTLRSGLEDAIRRQDTEAVAAYLGAGVQLGGYGCIGYQYKSNYALDLAVQQGNSMITELLFHYDDCDIKTSWNNESEVPLLIVAVQHNKPSQVRTLLHHGADKNAFIGNKSALQIARRNGYKEIVALLTQPTKPKAQIKPGESH